MKKNIQILAAALVIYVILICVLVQSESSNGNPISIGNAVWYSLITMTTVGYGDVTPVSFLGRCIGTVFALCSIGILAALIGVGIRFLEEQLLPQIRFFQNRNGRWYVFSEKNEDSVALAAALRTEDKDAFMVFLQGEKKSSFPGAVCLNAGFPNPISKIETHKDSFFFFMGDSLWDNYIRGLDVAEKGFQTYCMANVDEEKLPLNLHLFSREEVLGRCYWQKNPLKKSENVVILIGCGSSGSALLERAVLTNIFEVGRTVSYHIFEDTADFQEIHHELADAMSAEKTDGDVLLFHKEHWSADPDLILDADRIIICADSDRENLNTYETLKKWFVSKGNIHIRLSRSMPGVSSFGGREEILTPELVMKDALNRQAIVMNDIYNKGSPNPTQWKELSRFLQESNIAAADHLLVKVRYLLEEEELTSLTAENCHRAYEKYLQMHPAKADIFREMEHRRWMRFSQMYNWKYSPIRNNAMRLHPLLLPYDQLPEKERRKDDFAWEMLGKLDF